MSEKEYKLDIDPRILELLGPHLYTNIYYILGELIANAYDADASNVYIIEENNKIIVEDDGTGMSYENRDIENYLQVAHESRKDKKDDETKLKKRKKMGRKGVGKLASLSVSENVNIKTIKNGEKSGFILSRYVPNDQKLKAIEENDITFEKIVKNGTSIEMLNPGYSLPKTLETLKNNLLKIFPLVDSTFKLHLIKPGKKELIVDESQNSLIGDLAALITLGEEYKLLNKYFKSKYSEVEKSLLENRSSKKIKLQMKNKEGILKDYELEIKGWIGVYKSTRDSKKERKDFSDNFISLYANKKMGEFNILPQVGKNKLVEVFVVGQLHVDLFEETELPDMALSNRQGYKDDDLRYTEVLDYVRDDLLPAIIYKRKKFSDLNKKEKEDRKWKKQKENEEKLKASMTSFKKQTSKNVAEKIGGMTGNILGQDDIVQLLESEIDNQSQKMGIKATVDNAKKKILISHTKADKNFADVIYKMLVFNGFSKEEILYSNCDDEEARIPVGKTIYDYLRDFFVDSLSTEKIYVVYVTSEAMGASWGAISEVGAGWITQVDHTIFNLNGFKPNEPLDTGKQWQSTIDYNGDLYTDTINFDIFCTKLQMICEELEKEPKSKEDNVKELSNYLNKVDSTEFYGISKLVEK